MQMLRESTDSVTEVGHLREGTYQLLTSRAFFSRVRIIARTRNSVTVQYLQRKKRRLRQISEEIPIHAIESARRYDE